MSAKRIIAACVISVFGTPLFAADHSKEIISYLESSGFRFVGSDRTWLGRDVIEVTDGNFIRVVVVERGSGLVILDDWKVINEDAPSVKVKAAEKKMRVEKQRLKNWRRDRARGKVRGVERAPAPVETDVESKPVRDRVKDRRSDRKSDRKKNWESKDR